MKIAILDCATLMGEGLDWSKISSLGECSFFERTPPELTLQRAKDADIILVNKVLIKKEHIDNLPNLKYVGILATGCNNVDLEYCRLKNITVTNIPQYSSDSVAQASFAHILNLANSVEENSIDVKNGGWVNSPDFCYTKNSLEELAGKTIGLIGYGQIGKRTAKIAKAFAMKVIAYAPSKKAGTSDECASFENLETIFSNSDIISLHCPLNENTREIINKKNLDLCKKGVWIINTSRGPLINESDLADAIKSGKVAKASVDVLSVEPPKQCNPLLNLKNCHITSHNAWMTNQARKRLLEIAADNIRMWLQSNPKNTV